MRKLSALASALTLVCLVGSGCYPADAVAPEQTPPVDQITLARATTSTTNTVVPIALAVFVPCALDGAGEVIVVSGNLHILFHLTVNDNNFSAKSHFQPQQLAGTGLTSGDKYQGTGVTQNTQTGSFVNGKATFTSVNNFRMIGQGPGNNYLVHQAFHFTFNANGDLTVVHDNSTIDCK